VPSDAKVYINGSLTRSQGSLRRYVSKGLDRGLRYGYEVRAELNRNGVAVDQTKYVSLRAGRVTTLDFDFTSDSPVETSLTLKVPSDAKVILSGTETKATGPVRKFRTQKIAEGVKWSDYRVEVVVERDGKTLTKQQEITINGGDQIELAFDFEAAQLANAR
jgi:uncharacterized protein (TIGR03000 family)